MRSTDEPQMLQIDSNSVPERSEKIVFFDKKSRGSDLLSFQNKLYKQFALEGINIL